MYRCDAGSRVAPVMLRRQGSIPDANMLPMRTMQVAGIARKGRMEAM